MLRICPISIGVSVPVVLVGKCISLVFLSLELVVVGLSDCLFSKKKKKQTWADDYLKFNIYTK